MAVVTGHRRVISAEQLAQFEEQGFLLQPALFGQEEIEDLRTTFQTMHEQGDIPGCFSIGSPEEIATDPLKRFPRMMHPHRFNPVARRAMLDARIMNVLADLFGEEALAAQSMFYWKPPQARGQALHQDNFYLRTYPGNCIAAWVAVDDCTEQNGCLIVSPGSHKLDIFCPEEADLSVSFTRHFVPVPAGLREAPVIMRAGDVLFFGGNLIHGSYPNRSADQFRRAFIAHYVGESSEQVSRFYKPLYRRNGSGVELADSPIDGGPCGSVEAKGPH